MNNLEKIGIGTTSFLATLGVSEIDIPSLVDAVVKLVIAIGTLYSLFKNSGNNSKNQ